MVGGTNPTPRRSPTSIDVGGGADPTLGKIPFWPMVGGIDPIPRRSPTSAGVQGGADPTSRRIPF